MSMYGFEYYRMEDPQPAWMRNERYEYCEPFESAPLFERTGFMRLPFIQFLISLF